MMILGIFIGLVIGAVLGIALSFPIGSAVGILLDRTVHGWAIGIEMVFAMISVYIIYRMFEVKWKKG